MAQWGVGPYSDVDRLIVRLFALRIPITQSVLSQKAFRESYISKNCAGSVWGTSINCSEGGFVHRVACEGE